MRGTAWLSGRTLIAVAAGVLLVGACGGDDDDGGDATTDTASPATEQSTDAPTETSIAETSIAETSMAETSIAETSMVETSAAETSEGSAASGTVDLSGVELTVGSKEFNEQLILGSITIQVLEGAGASVSDQTGLVGSATVREALLSGEIDMYWEYTGTGWITHLGNTAPVVGTQEQYEAVRDADLEANNVHWLTPAPFNNTYAIAVGPAAAGEIGVATLSELSAYLGENPDQASLCAATEFLTRDDGLPGLEAAYGFTFGDVVELDLGLVYPSVAEGSDCVFGEVFATDGRIAALDLTVLEDDLSFFPSYLPALNVTDEAFQAAPGLEELFTPVAAALDTATMQGLNQQVDVDGEQPEDVATAWLTENGFIG